MTKTNKQKDDYKALSIEALRQSKKLQESENERDTDHSCQQDLQTDCQHTPRQERGDSGYFQDGPGHAVTTGFP